MLKATAIRTASGITVASKFEGGSSVNVMEEVVAIVEDVVTHLSEMHTKEDTEATKKQYFKALSQVFNEISEE